MNSGNFHNSPLPFINLLSFSLKYLFPKCISPTLVSLYLYDKETLSLIRATSMSMKSGYLPKHGQTLVLNYV